MKSTCRVLLPLRSAHVSAMQLPSALASFWSMSSLRVVGCADQRCVLRRVDLVDEDHQRTRHRLRPRL